ncbi:SOS response-associated peptidase [Sanguibacter gelidistatuariae]|nr:SOS response-associated peptidase [Sanguibacter gelidistatuariae]
MCGRFAMNDAVNAMITDFVLATGRDPSEWMSSWVPSYNIRPTDPVPILLETFVDRSAPSAPSAPSDPTAPTARRAELAQWWLTPSSAKALRGSAPMFNARSETVTERPAFRHPVKRQRAVIPAAGYFETMTLEGKKVPQFVRPPHGLLYFAGLYSWWADPDLPAHDPARWHLTTTILTREAVGEIARVHDRTPVTLPRDLVDTWIDPHVLGDAGLVHDMVDAATDVAETLVFHRVASPIRGDSPETIAPA